MGRKPKIKKLLAAAAAVLLTTAVPGYAKTLTIGVSMALFDDNFLTSVRQAMADCAKTVPEVQNFMSQKVDAIVVNVVDTAATRNITNTRRPDR